MGSQHKYDLVFDKSEPRYAETLFQQYSITTVGNECKWGAIQRKRGVLDFSKCEASIQLAIHHNTSFRGHNLCWGNHNPSWLLNGNFTPVELSSLLEDYVTQVVKHFGTRVYCWDVVNEAVDNNGLKTAPPWYPAVPNYVDLAFHAARKAEPTGSVKLFYNDFAGDAINAKSDQVYALVKSMKARGVPIDGVGLQMHISTAKPPPKEGVQKNIQRLVDLGLEVHVTELDVKCFDCNTTAGLEKEAQVYANMLSACLAVKGCKSFETWGFTDKYTWLNSRSCKDELCYPLPFDKDYNPKPAVQAMLDVLNNTAVAV